MTFHQNDYPHDIQNYFRCIIDRLEKEVNVEKSPVSKVSSPSIKQNTTSDSVGHKDRGQGLQQSENWYIDAYGKKHFVRPAEYKRLKELGVIEEKKYGGSLPSYKGASTSITGYQGKGPNSGPYIIPSGDITMKGVNFPLIGTDNLGNTKIMKPGKNYKFPGSSVYETPLMKKGGKIGCGCKGACAKCGGHLPKYFGGGDIDWGEALQAGASGTGTGVTIGSAITGVGTALGAGVGFLTGVTGNIFGQSNQFKADEQAKADWDAFQEQRKADAKQFSALNKYINPNLSSTPAVL